MADLRSLRERYEYEENHPWEFHAEHARTILELVAAVEAAYGLVLAMEQDDSTPSLHIRACRDEVWNRLRRFDDTEWA